MAIVIVCGGCQRTFEVADRYAGQQIRCPKCGYVIHVPASDSSQVAAELEVRPSRPRRPRERSAAKPQPVAPSTESDPPPAVQAIFPDAQESDQLSRFRAQHANDWHIPVWVWFLCAGVILFGGLGWVLWHRFGGPSAETVSGAMTRQQAALKEPAEEISRPIQLPPRPEDPALVSAIQAAKQPYVVQILVHDSEGNRLASPTGWIFDTSGLVVTTYHNVCAGAGAQVEFDSGSRADVLGYRVIRSDLDLAILQYEPLPGNDPSTSERSQKMPMLQAGWPEEGGEVLVFYRDDDMALVAIEGRVIRTVTTDSLPEPELEFVRRLGGVANHVWIEHDGVLPSGANGGPLVDYDGRVIGVNSWIGSGSAYALHARQVHDALEDKFRKPLPMAEHRKPSTRSDQLNPDGPAPEVP